MQATIIEQGNGFPGAGDYAEGGGVLYRILTVGNTISTHGQGRGSSIEATVVEEDYADCPDDEVHTARVVTGEGA